MLTKGSHPGGRSVENSENANLILDDRRGKGNPSSFDSPVVIDSRRESTMSKAREIDRREQSPNGGVKEEESEVYRTKRRAAGDIEAPPEFFHGRFNQGRERGGGRGHKR